MKMGSMSPVAKRRLMKTLSFVFGLISILLWWEIPYSVAYLMAINAIILFKTYDKSFVWIMTAVISIIALGLAIWNWDLHAGMYIVENYLH